MSPDSPPETRTLVGPVEHAVAAQDGDLVLLHEELDAADMLVDHGVPALRQRAVVEADALVAGEAELGALLGHPMQQVGGLEQRLGGNAAPIQAGAPETVTLDEANRQPELRGADGAHVAHAAAEDEQVEALLFGHGSPGGVVQLVAAVAAGWDASASRERPSCWPMRRRQSVWYRHGACRGVVVGDEDRLHIADQPVARRGGHAVAHGEARAADAIHAGLDHHLLAERDRRAKVELDPCEDQWQSVERLIRLEDLEQVLDSGQLDVAEEDRVVHVPEGIGVAEAHLQCRAVAEVIGHGGPF